jgi:uncharacterized UBP type Zn finger protein
MDNPLNKMSEVFGTTFSGDNIEEIKHEIEVIDEKKNIIANKDIKSITLEDQQFLQDELKTLIMVSRTVLGRLEADIKIGTAARVYEVYARLLDAVTNQYRELRELNKTIVDIQIDQGKLNNSNNIGNKISLTADQLLNMVDKARARSDINKIDAVFKVEE